MEVKGASGVSRSLESEPVYGENNRHVCRQATDETVFMAGRGYGKSCLTSIAIWDSICLLFLRYKNGFSGGIGLFILV